MSKSIIISFWALLLSCSAFCQEEGETIGGFYFGPKLGLTLGTQNWDGAERRPMANYHFALYTESLDPDKTGSLFAQVGYHSRGSGLNIVNLTLGFNSNQAFIYRNLNVTLGVKKRLLTEKLSTPYYFVGVRGEYQLSNNLAETQDRFQLGASSLFYPVDIYVNKFTYGLSFGGGFEFQGSKFVQPGIEFTFSPDLNFQYRSPEIPFVTNPFNGLTTSLPERKIRNLTFEISLVLRFLREVIYLD